MIEINSNSERAVYQLALSNDNYNDDIDDKENNRRVRLKNKRKKTSQSLY